MKKPLALTWLCCSCLFAGCGLWNGAFGSRTVLYEHFESQGDWSLVAEKNVGIDGEDDALAQIHSGVLTLVASQHFGCPEANAVLDLEIAIPEIVADSWAFRAEIIGSEITALGSISLEFESTNSDVEIQLSEFVGTDGLADCMLTLKYREHKNQLLVVIDGAAVDTKNLTPLGRLMSIGIFTRACGADGFAFAHIQLDSVRLTAY